MLCNQHRLELARDFKVGATVATQAKLSPGELIMPPERREATLFALLKRDAAIWRGRQRRNADFEPEISPRPPQSKEALAKQMPSWTAERRQAVRERTGTRGRPPNARAAGKLR
jgi:hypothetical protein